LSVASESAAYPAGRLTISLERVRLGLLWTLGFSSGIVFYEPAPYEFLLMLAIGAFAVTGLKIRAAHVPLLIMMIGTIIAYAIGVLPVANKDDTVKWTVVSIFLAVSSMFFALALAENTQGRLNALMAGYIAGAVLVSLIGIAAWFHVIPGTDLFLINGRARSTFKDANVLGAYLVLPATIVIGRLLTGQYRSFVLNAGIAGILSLGLLFSFSRGAWAHFVGALFILVVLHLMTAPTVGERARVAVFAAIGIALAVVLLGLILSIDAVGALFQERASLVQSYDAGPQGRFGRHVAGILLMLDHPFGIGPMQFTDYFTEDPHNSFLNAFVAGGWLGGVFHAMLVITTLIFGLREVFRRSPWQRTYIAVFATFAAEVGESYIIDVQHWRHFYLLIGVIWGLIAVREVTRRSAVAPDPAGLYIPPPQRSVAQPG
jgi:hypothetical protein